MKDKILSLGINTATQTSSVCLLLNEKVIGKKSWNEKSQESKFLIPAIQEMLDEAKYQVKDIDQLILIKGPGPFTGIRIGVVLANALAQNIPNIKVFTLNTFQFLSLRSESKAQHILINAGGEMLFKLDTENLKAEELDEEIVSKNVVIQKASDLQDFTAETDISEKQAEILVNNISFLYESKSFAEVCSKLIEENALSKYSESEMPVIPFYLKNPSIN